MAALTPRGPFATFVCRACRQRGLSRSGRSLSSTTSASAENERPSQEPLSVRHELRSSLPRRRSNTGGSALEPRSSSFSQILDTPQSLITDTFSRNADSAQERNLPHRLNVYAHKHNTHITLSQPPRAAAEMSSLRTAGARLSSKEQKKVVDTVMSLSAGNIGFRKANRGSYDAGFQLAAFALKQMEEKGIAREMNKMEVILRGFGAGREAVTKALLGTEGRLIRGKISAVKDATRLKHGGSRSKKPRRLG